MEGEAGSNLSDETPHDSSHQLVQGVGDVRYWSDFGRVYYLPRSLHKLPDSPEWESTDPGWVQGQEMFTRHNEVDMNIGYHLECIDINIIGCRTHGRICSSLCWGLWIDAGNQRLNQFYSSCKDLLRQGFQIMNDVDAFGSFTSSFVITLRDEYPKMTSIVFPLMSNGASRTRDIPNVRSLDFSQQVFTGLTCCCFRYRTRDSYLMRQCICARLTIAHPWTSLLNIRHNGISLFGENRLNFRCVLLPRSVCEDWAFFNHPWLGT